MKLLSITLITSIIGLQCLSQGSMKNGDVGKFLAEFRMIPGTVCYDNSFINIRSEKFRISIQEVSSDSLYLFQFRNQKYKAVENNKAIVFTKQQLRDFENALTEIIINKIPRQTLAQCTIVNLGSGSSDGIAIIIEDECCFMSGKTAKRLLKKLKYFLGCRSEDPPMAGYYTSRNVITYN